MHLRSLALILCHFPPSKIGVCSRRCSEKPSLRYRGEAIGQCCRIEHMSEGVQSLLRDPDRMLTECHCLLYQRVRPACLLHRTTGVSVDVGPVRLDCPSVCTALYCYSHDNTLT